MLNVSSNSGNYASAINLKGYYRFNEGSGTSLQDNSSNSNTGTTGATWTAGFVSEYGVKLKDLGVQIGVYQLESWL